MSVTGFAISTILSIAASVWLFVVGRGAKEWRLRWLDLFGLHDADTPRPMRQAQERQLRYMSFFLLLLDRFSCPLRPLCPLLAASRPPF